MAHASSSTASAGRVSMALPGEGPTLVLGEDDLWRLTEILDEKVFTDPKAREYGYVKVQLAEGLQAQSTTLQQFFDHYHNKPSKLFKSLNLSSLVNSSRESTRDKLFYVNQHGSKPEDGEKFQQLVNDYIKSQGHAKSCCVAELEKGGLSSYISHLKEYLHSVSSPDTRHCKRSSRKKTCVATVNTKERFNQLMETPLERRGAALVTSMKSEDVLPPGTDGGFGCQCINCIKISPYNSTASSNSIPYLASVPVEIDHQMKMTENFCMSYLTAIGMLRQLNEFFLGVSCPAAYIGSPHSLFYGHIEDLSLWSFNFIHDGEPKVWIIISPKYVRDVSRLLAREGFDLNATCSLILLHKSYFFLPELLDENEIPYSLVVQRKGEGIIVLPNAVHAGSNLGVNFAEACNLASRSWIPYGLVSKICSCVGEMVHADISKILISEGMWDMHKAYKSSNITDFMKNDHYFQRSILFPKKTNAVEPSTSIIPVRGQSQCKHQKEAAQVSCPVAGCSHVRRTNMKKAWASHLRIAHPTFVRTQDVKTFCEKYNVPL